MRTYIVHYNKKRIQVQHSAVITRLEIISDKRPRRRPSLFLLNAYNLTLAAFSLWSLLNGSLLVADWLRNLTASDLGKKKKFLNNRSKHVQNCSKQSQIQAIMWVIVFWKVCLFWKYKRFNWVKSTQKSSSSFEIDNFVYCSGSIITS